MALFDRLLRVCFIQADLILQSDEFSMAYTARKDLSTKPNSAELRIYNLKAETRNRINILGEEVFISSGYIEDVGTRFVFVGNTLRVLHNRIGPDIVTTVYVGDGANSIREARIVESFDRGAKIQSVVESVTSKMGLATNFNDVTFEGEFANGFIHNGPAARALDIITRTKDVRWFINNQVLNFVRPDGATNKPVVPIDNTNGLLAEPEELLDQGKGYLFDLSNSAVNLTFRANRGVRTDTGLPDKSGYRISTLLNPLFNPGTAVNVDVETLSKPIQGRFRINEVLHVASSFQQAFYSTIDVEEL